ncbi:pitrilysin family protein [Streptomyces sp. SID13031]|uniref:M16 family metallopeptidase n=1 Tax=Streptomyces sp. SID13031 TaxID=2706046 RepID=UPI0013CD73A6|nr:pitrilysin family protein [Streptomyces sp. SID13031]NEA33868.1 insulinase family protein [Streptomyces sp. SID13031]
MSSQALTTPPAVAPPRPWRFPVATSTTTRSGTPVHVFDRPGQYVATVRVTVAMPLAIEPRELEGVATIMSRTLDEGTELKSANEFAAALERHGAAYGVDVSSDALHVEISVPTSQLAPAVKLLAEAITRPAFNQADVGRHVTIRLGEINQERANAGYRAREAFAANLFGPSTRRSRPTAGTPDTIRPLTNVQVAEFYHANIGPARAEILFAGDATGVDVAAVIDDAFGDWTADAGTAIETPEPLYIAGDKLVLVDRPGSVQSQLLIGCPGPDRREDIWGAAAVANHVVGGTITSRVDTVLREEKGYTYGTRTSFTAPRKGGTFSLGGAVRTEVTGAAIGDALKILLEARDGLTAREVQEAQDSLIRTAPLRYEQADSVAQQVGSNIAAGVPLDFADTYLAQIAATTAESATEAYRRYVGANGLLVVVVGEAKEVRSQLTGLKIGDITELS